MRISLLINDLEFGAMLHSILRSRHKGAGVNVKAGIHGATSDRLISKSL